MGTPWDKDEGPSRSPNKHQTQDKTPGSGAQPFAAPDTPARDGAPTFRFQEQSIESVTGQFKAFQAAPTPTEPFSEPQPMHPPAKEDPLYSFLVSQQGQHTPLPGHSESRPSLSAATGPQKAQARNIDMHTPPPGAPLPLRINQPAIEMNTRPSDSGSYRQAPPLQRPPQPLQRIQPQAPAHPIPELYDPFFSSWGSEEQLSSAINAADTRQLHAVPEEIYVPFLQEDLLDIEESVVHHKSQSATSLPAQQRAGVGGHPRLREDLSLPPSRHMPFEEEENLVSDWMSHDALPAAQPDINHTNEQGFAYIKAGKSLLNRFERVVLPTAGIEYPISQEQWQQPNMPSGSGPGYPASSPHMTPPPYTDSHGQMPGNPYAPYFHPQQPMYGQHVPQQMQYPPQPYQAYPPGFPQPMQPYPYGPQYPQSQTGLNPRQRGKLMHPRRRSWWQRLMRWLVKLFTS